MHPKGGIPPLQWHLHLWYLHDCCWHGAAISVLVHLRSNVSLLDIHECFDELRIAGIDLHSQPLGERLYSKPLQSIISMVILDSLQLAFSESQHYPQLKPALKLQSGQELEINLHRHRLMWHGSCSTNSPCACTTGGIKVLPFRSSSMRFHVSPRATFTLIAS